MRARIAIALSFLFLTLSLPNPGLAQLSTTGFEETFALARDRREALKELIPGTVEYYFYSCLERQQAGKWAEVDALLANWIRRHGRDARVEEIENRQALLQFSDNPEGTWGYLKKKLKLTFDHAPDVSDRDRDLPTTLSPELVSREAWTKRALDQYPGSLRGITSKGIWALASSQLDDDLLVALMNKLTTSDIPDLPALFLRALKRTKNFTFTSLRVASCMTQAQMDECVRLRPEFLQDETFVYQYIKRLAPGEHVDPRFNQAEQEKYLDRLQAFAGRLTSSHNSFKAMVLFNRLKHNLAQGRFDKDLFLSYLRLPQSTNYVNEDYLERPQNIGKRVERNSGFPTSLERIEEGDALVRAYFEHFFVTETTTAPYADFVDEDYLNRVMAETKILAGVGDMERWYSLLDDADYYEKLKNRVEINLCPQNRSSLAIADAVRIAADIKNVSTLLVKVYRINTTNYYTEVGKEVDASIQIDGLVASEEMTFNYEDSPLRRVRRDFEFPGLNGAGVWVIDFIGNGISSRAVINKGRLHFRERRGAAGHIFKIMDDEGRLLKDAAIKFGVKIFNADDQGEIQIPFSTRQGSKKIILLHKNRSTLSKFYHYKERYDLMAPAYVRQESLVGGAEARIIIRPTLRVTGVPISLEFLKSNLLTIKSMDHYGVASTVQVRDIKLVDGQDIVHTIRVPDNLSSLSVEFSGSVRRVSTNSDFNLKARQTRFTANGIDRTNDTRSTFLTRTRGGYEIQVLGKNGEPVSDAPLTVSLRHDHYKREFEASLKTDARGRARLGRLDGVNAVSTKALHAKNSVWLLTDRAARIPAVLHIAAGETARLPYVAAERDITPANFALYEIRRRSPFRSCLEKIEVRSGLLEVTGLEPGNYELSLKALDRTVSIQVSGGERREDWAFGGARMLELSSPSPLTIRNARIDSDDLVVQCLNGGSRTRVHVMATHYLPANRPFSSLLPPSVPRIKDHSLERSINSYNSGVVISDEYRYILDRRFAQKFPGNMLKRPGILLNPWSIDSADEVIGLGGGAGGRFGGRRGGSAAGGAAPGGSQRAPGADPLRLASLGFMGSPRPIVVNLRPDANGEVRVPLKDLGTGHLIQVLALDGSEHVSTSLVRDRVEHSVVDQRLQNPLAPDKYFTKKQSIDLIRAGETATIEDISKSRAEQFAALQDVFDVYQTLNPGQGLEQFAFLMKWPSLDQDVKKGLYAEHACHELNFFLYKKDRKFFDDIIKPYLSNKAAKTFMDHWLLGFDLKDYLDPWAYSRLNTFEQLLLLRRVESDPAIRGRYAKELHDLRPVAEDIQHKLFDTVLGNKSLEPSRNGLPALTRELGAFRKRLDRRVVPKKANKIAVDAEAPEEEFEDDEAEKSMEDADEIARFEEMSKSADSKDLALRQSFARDKSRRRQAQNFFRAVEATRRYAEHNYWHRKIEATTPGMIGMNGFWYDFATNQDEGSFLSPRFFEAAGNFAEMMLAMSVLDLPFVSGEHETSVDNGKARLVAKSSLLLVREELAEAEPGDSEIAVIASQTYFKADDRYTYVGREKRNKNVKDEFLRGHVYGSSLVITNPNAVRLNLKVLSQIPAGAIPTNNGRITYSNAFTLEGYRTRTIEFYFYFPQSGSFTQCPASVTSDGRVVASTKAKSFTVVDRLSKSDSKSWAVVSQKSTDEEVLQYLNDNNIRRLDLSKSAWRLKSPAFFKGLTELLRQRYLYSDVVWSYGIHHRDEKAAREFLSHQSRFLSSCGSYLESPLVSIDPVERKTYQHIEYAPLVNSRAHQFGSQRKIENTSLAAQFKSLMSILGYRSKLSDADLFSVTYYLLLQDRIGEARELAARIDAKNVPSQLQYDYLRAYLDFFTEDHVLARPIAERHQNHPNPRWRERFQTILAQLDEAEGKEIKPVASTDETTTQDELAAKQPSLDLKVDARNLVVAHQNIGTCTVSYFEMDIEFLFSTNPFVRNDAGSFAFVQPNRQQTVVLDSKNDVQVVPLPEDYHNSNLLVEVRGEGIVKRQTVFANSLQVRMRENYGQLQVVHAETTKPLPKVYVKVFAREGDGTVRFHKDGYTDIRGRFDYASLSGPKGTSAKRYSILLMSENDGAMVREAASPTE